MLYKVGEKVDYSKLHWQSDWGYDEIYCVKNSNISSVIGLYSDPNNEKVDYYIDVDTHKVVEVLIEGEEDYQC